MFFNEEIIRQAINDKGYRVREKAAEACYQCNLIHLVPLLEESFVKETNEKAKKAIELFLCLLRDGFQLTQYDGRTNLTFRNEEGIKSVIVELDEVTNKEKIKELILKK